VIRFTASVAQVKTMADGGIRLVLDLPETSIDIAAAMMQARQAGAVLECACLAVIQDKPKEIPLS
jgi:fructose-1,6-bisphosphatase/inositol monophosphatase family enzyme